MRLWHERLLSLLPRQQLLGQHRECCALRGKGWGKKHKDVDFVFTHPYFHLFKYHQLVMKEMSNRGYKVDPIWQNRQYRGKLLGYDVSSFTEEPCDHLQKYIYKEHNKKELIDNLENLKRKNITIELELVS